MKTADECFLAYAETTVQREASGLNSLERI